MMGNSMIDEPTHRLSRFFDGLGNGIRLKLVEELTNGRQYVSELARAVDRTSSAASRQLKKLADQDIVQSQTLGRKRFYFLKRPELIVEALALRKYFERE